MNLKSILEKSKKYPPGTIVKRAIHRALVLTRDYSKYVNDVISGTGLSDDDFREKVLIKKMEETRLDPPWQPSLNGEARDKVVEEANRAKDHVFDLLGSGNVRVDYKLRARGLGRYRYDMGVSDTRYSLIKCKLRSELGKVFKDSVEYKPIDWQVDFKSGYRWSEKVYSKFIKYGHKLGADVKFPWELSRMEHLLQLALAYRLTKREEYAEEIIKQAIDWIKSNPLKFGANWCCTMDVAIRAVNLLVATSLIEDYVDNLPPPGKEYFHKIFFKSIYQHGNFIIHNLEWSEITTGNHYLSDIAGLLVSRHFYGENFQRRRKLEGIFQKRNYKRNTKTSLSRWMRF